MEILKLITGTLFSMCVITIIVIMLFNLKEWKHYSKYYEKLTNTTDVFAFYDNKELFIYIDTNDMKIVYNVTTQTIVILPVEVVMNNNFILSFDLYKSYWYKKYIMFFHNNLNIAKIKKESKNLEECELKEIK